MANSAQMVFPLPVGAPTNTLSSLLYTVLNTENRQRGSVTPREAQRRPCGKTPPISPERQPAGARKRRPAPSVPFTCPSQHEEERDPGKELRSPGGLPEDAEANSPELLPRFSTGLLSDQEAKPKGTGSPPLPLQALSPGDL